MPSSTVIAKVQSLWCLAKLLIDKGISVKITWNCRHTGLAHNELADEEAKKAAQLAETLGSLTRVSVPTAKYAIKEHQLEHWQESWNSDSTRRAMYKMLLDVGLTTIPSVYMGY